MSIHIELLPPTDRRIRKAVPSKMCCWISSYAEAAARLAGVTTANWVIHLVNDKRMIHYHQQTMNLATITDVLTFNYTDTHIPNAPLDIETIICVDEAERQAIVHNHLLPELEMLLYAIHSLLHCVGYDDTSSAKALRMHRKEDALLRQMALPAVYYTSSHGAVSSNASNNASNNTSHKAAAVAMVSFKGTKTRGKGRQR